ncbi:SDR family NAD(P)-dependent oxidoreductase [Pseudomonas sp. DR48]|uniref:SDR family NAD(P)-dependent oxidoreductase n=1 Tax=Pseudomonas sp. DR48 TaxID=2871095 RepID=UPI001C99567F|nr:SDR family NAD(P)-dependent oxidoreductase [Pseudomonas sp. DR48]QZP31036.1 SDR family NAD(P)-dependent oxidoreductase [Pseudomonas sp. DR48]
MKKPSAVVVGVGAFNGLGATLCKLFASKGFHVWVAGRTEEKLEAIADHVRLTGGTANAFVMDATKEQQVLALFTKTMQHHEDREPPSLVVFNTSNFARTPIREISAEQFEDHWRVGCLAGFLVGREAAKCMSANGGGTLLFSGASASLRGKANYAHFASAKAGLRMVAQSMARELGTLGVHVAHVVLDGGIMREHQAAASRLNVRNNPKENLMDFDAIAQTYWQIHEQPRSAWTHEIDLRASGEAF